MNSLTRPDLTQECLAGRNWRPSSAIHACAVWWPGMALSDNTWGESTSVPGSRKLGMNINQSCCPIRSDSIVDLCLEENAVSLTQHMLMRRFGLAVWKSGNSWFSEPYIFELINIILKKNNWLEVWEFMLYMNLYITFNLYLYYTHIIINND